MNFLLASQIHFLITCYYFYVLFCSQRHMNKSIELAEAENGKQLIFSIEAKGA